MGGEAEDKRGGEGRKRRGEGRLGGRDQGGALDTPLCSFCGRGPGWRLRWPSTGGWGQVRERPPRLALFHWRFWTFLGERESYLSTFISIVVFIFSS